MEQSIAILIYIHAVFGGIALLAGLVAMTAKKGLGIHKRSGVVFYYSMMISSGVGMLVALLPNHENPFLLAVGIFSLYLVLTGRRALRFKRKIIDLKIDKLISRVMILIGMLMILLPIFLSGSLNIVLFVFGIVAVLLSIQDLRLFKNPEKLRDGWLKLHLGKMIGAYIAASTAFVIVNEFFPRFYGWFIPGIIGTFFIIYWIRKVNRKSSPN